MENNASQQTHTKGNSKGWCQVELKGTKKGRQEGKAVTV